MVKRFFKHKLLLDENVPHRQYFPTLNERFDVKHVAGDYQLNGLSDPKVYELARKEGRLLVTYNIEDFRTLAKLSSDTGVIGISPKLTTSQLDKRLTALLRRSGKKALLGELTSLSTA